MCCSQEGMQPVARAPASTDWCTTAVVELVLLSQELSPAQTRGAYLGVGEGVGLGVGEGVGLRISSVTSVRCCVQGQLCAFKYVQNKEKAPWSN